MNVLTNTWMDASEVKPWNFRLCLVRFSDGDITLGMWNGQGWVGKTGINNRIDRVREVTHFYVFERFTDKSSY